MTYDLGRIAAVGALLTAIFGSAPVSAQKPGGILRVHAGDSPPSLSVLEEVDAVPARATMGLFNNLVMFDQHVKQNSMQSIVPDLRPENGVGRLCGRGPPQKTCSVTGGVLLLGVAVV